MNNLLLEEDKRKVKKEYLARLFIVFLFLLSFLGVVFFLSLLPSDIFSWSKERNVKSQKQITDQAVVSLESEDFNSLIKDMREKVSSLKGENNSIPLYIVMEKILSHKNSGINIKGFTFKPGNIKGRETTVEGVALSRDNLVEFSKSLEQEKTFTVSLPVSNFAKQNNIDFTLNIIVHAD